MALLIAAYAVVVENTDVFLDLVHGFSSKDRMTD